MQEESSRCSGEFLGRIQHLRLQGIHKDLLTFETWSTWNIWNNLRRSEFLTGHEILEIGPLAKTPRTPHERTPDNLWVGVFSGSVVLNNKSHLVTD